MVLLAATLKLNIPYSEYWLPLIIGLGVGAMCLVVARVFGRRALPAVAAPVDRARQDYDPFVHGSPTDQRKSFRRGGNPVEVFYSVPEHKDNAQIGWVFDRSVGGLGLIAASEWPAETVLAVRPTNAPQMTPWVEVEVRSCRQTEDGYELGCKFVRVPPWSILLMFG